MTPRFPTRPGPLKSIPWKWGRLLLAGAALLCLRSALSASEDLLWFEDGRPSREARQAVEILGRATADGLVPDDYGAETLSRAVEWAAVAGAADLSAAWLDAQLSLAMQHYLADLHGGRVDPRLVDENYDPTSPTPFDPAAYLRSAVRAHRLAEAVRQAAPSSPLYANLRAVLAEYRKLAGHPAWAARLPPLPGRKLTPGTGYAGVALLAERLIALGDLPSETMLPDRYQGVVVEGVRAFQARHGLEADGVIGKATLASLAVSPDARVRQIEINLERLRWTPLLREARMVVINVPEFMLRAYTVDAGRIEVQASMKVVLGKAMKTRTPIFTEDMRFIEFSPYWNVPPSIARDETVPRLRRDAAYFVEQGFEFVGRDGRVLTALSPASLDAVLRGELRIRQRPGPKNALGDIKFIFPNSDHIFLHHTPATQLFKRTRRDFSHGCIRVEEPVALARFVLQDTPEWTEARILEAMGKGTSAILRLARPVRVLIAYSTAVVEADGRVHFLPDLYGHDERLGAALRRHRAPGAASHPASGGAQ